MEENRFKLESYNDTFCEIHDIKTDEWYKRKDLIVDLLNQQDDKINELEDSLREANECLSQIYSHLGVEAFGKDIQRQAVKEIDRLMDLEQEFAELKQKAIIPKFRTYQPIFYITQYYTSTKGNPEYDIISDKYYVAENENEIILGWNYAKDFNKRKYYYVRKDWVFATKEEAEQKLAEIGL